MRAILGSILDTAAVATSPDNFTQILRKLDNTGYSYLGRSYGVGAGVGFSRAINNTLETKEGLKSYEFTEWGYMVNISCSYDYNTNFTIHSPSSSDERPTYYHAKGFVDNGSYESVYMPGEDDSQVVAMLENPFHGRNVLAIATGKTAVNYQELNQTSCELFFNKHAFNVSVEHETRFISVSPLPPEQNPEEEDPEVLGERWMMLQNNTVRQMGAVVQVSGARFFTPLGNALLSNIANTKKRSDKGIIPTSSEEELALLGISTAFEAMVDSILVAFSSAQYVIAGENGNGTTITEARASYTAVVFGGPTFIWIITAVNTIIVLVSLCEAFRNRAGITRFDYSDIYNLVVGASRLGPDSSRYVDELQPISNPWAGDPEGRSLGGVRVKVVRVEVDPKKDEDTDE